MPKLKDVETNKNSMSWKEINLNNMGRSISISIPKRELEGFLSKGYNISKVKITFDKNKKLEINKSIENGTKEKN